MLSGETEMLKEELQKLSGTHYCNARQLLIHCIGTKNTKQKLLIYMKKLMINDGKFEALR